MKAMLVGVVAVLVLAGCPGDGLPPREVGANVCADGDTRCHPTTHVPQVCADRRWFVGDPCTAPDGCCLIPGIQGSAGPVYACAPASACLPEGTSGDEIGVVRAP